MTRQTGVIITVIVAVLTLCCSTACCASGVIAAASGGQWLDDITMEWYYGLPLICLGIVVWIVPLLLWLFLVRAKEDIV